MFYILSKILIGGNNMVALYVALIIAGRRTFDRVPVRFREAVKADLEAIGLDENGNPMDQPKPAGSLLHGGLPCLIKRGLG